MTGLKRIFILINKEFTEFYSSKAWILVLILPLFITFLFATVYHQTDVTTNYRIAYLPPLRADLRTILIKSGLRTVAYQRLTVAKAALAQNTIAGIPIGLPESSGRQYCPERHLNPHLCPSGPAAI
jgi:hypothetical protein